jgi:hypothetical protein
MKLLLSKQPANPLRQERRLRHHHRHPLDGPLALTAQTLLAWLQSQLVEGESVGQVFLSQTARTATTRQPWTPKATNHKL